MFSPGELNCPSVANWLNSVEILLQFAVCSVLRKHHKKEQNTLGHLQVCTRIFIHPIIKASIWLIGGNFVQLNKQPKKKTLRGKAWKRGAAIAQRVGARRSQRRVCVMAASQSETLLAVSL